MYIDSRRWSACQSVASASSELSLTHCGYHWIPCVLMPRNWIGWLYWLQSLVPQTCNCPLIDTGVSTAGCGAATAVAGELGTSVAAASRMPAAKERIMGTASYCVGAGDEVGDCLRWLGRFPISSVELSDDAERCQPVARCDQTRSAVKRPAT